MNKKRFGKNDIIFIGGLLAIAIILFIFIHFFNDGNGTYVEVTVDGEIYGTYSLEEDQMVEIKKDGKVTNILSIKGGKADMIDADCPDLLCVHQRAISKENETIVCLPNKVVVKIVGTKGKNHIDAIAG